MIKKPLILIGLLLLNYNTDAKIFSKGTIFGTVTIEDSYGVNRGKIPKDCHVIAVNQDTNEQNNSKVYSDGTYKISILKFGTYDVLTQCQEYKESNKKAITVNSTDKIEVNMAVGLNPETVYLNPEIRPSHGMSNLIDMESSLTFSYFSDDILNKLPVERSLTAVTLLAPGTVLGDSEFGNLASIHGASVAENGYYINGMEVSNFRNGLGSSTAPYDFFDGIKVTTAGYGAEFGHATGGIIEAETKSGGNNWEYGIRAEYAPKELRKSNYDVYRQDGTLFAENIHSSLDEKNLYIHASGPIIKDKLFIYALYNPRDIDAVNIEFGGNQLLESRIDSGDFWGTKIDWAINDKHQLELTAFSDKQKRITDTYSYDRLSHQTNQLVEEQIQKSGGENYSLNYTGEITPDFSVSMLLGHNKFNRFEGQDGYDIPAIYDSRNGGISIPPCCEFNTPIFKIDTRNQYKISANLSLSYIHQIQMGIDYQNNTSLNLETYPGGIYYRYYDAVPGQEVQGGIIPEDVSEIARVRIFRNGGYFDANNQAFFIQDNWSVTDDLTLNLGLRNESFDNKNTAGDSFLKISNVWAPRLSGTWNINGNNNAKLYVNLGRYYLPIPSMTNIQYASSELFNQTYFVLEDTNDDLTPILGGQIGDVAFIGDGAIADANAIRDSNIKPTYQDEFVLGFEKVIFDKVIAGAKYIYRDLGNVIEDIAIDAAVVNWAGDRLTIDGETASDTWTGFHQYVLTNPGHDMRVYLPEYGEFADLTAEQLGYPEGDRRYNALELYFNKFWDGNFMLQGSYVYSISKGNYEGWVRSDNGQSDAGLTNQFDQVGLVNGSYGLLPNDRTHVFKLFGAWSFKPKWTLGCNSYLSSGRPINAFGINYDDQFAAQYGAESFYQDGQLVPRGSRGRTPFVSNLDLSLSYEYQFGRNDATALFKVDVFNVFDAHNSTEIIETAEEENGSVNLEYLLPRSFQQPQYLKFSANFAF